MNYHSKTIDEPLVSHISCDGCGYVYEELASLVWARRNGLIGLLFCLECDETSKQAPRLLGGPDDNAVQ